jgi:hypothetical protein
MFAYKEQYPGTSHQNICSYFSLSLNKPLLSAVLEIFRVPVYCHSGLNAIIGGRRSVVL